MVAPTFITYRGHTFPVNDQVNIRDANALERVAKETGGSRVFTFSTGEGSILDQNVRVITNHNAAGQPERGKLRVEIIHSDRPREVFERPSSSFPQIVKQVLGKGYQPIRQHRIRAVQVVKANPNHDSEGKFANTPNPKHEKLNEVDRKHAITSKLVPEINRLAYDAHAAVQPEKDALRQKLQNAVDHIEHLLNSEGVDSFDAELIAGGIQRRAEDAAFHIHQGFTPDPYKANPNHDAEGKFSSGELSHLPEHIKQHYENEAGERNYSVGGLRDAGADNMKVAQTENAIEQYQNLRAAAKNGAGGLGIKEIDAALKDLHTHAQRLDLARYGNTRKPDYVPGDNSVTTVARPEKEALAIHNQLHEGHRDLSGFSREGLAAAKEIQSSLLRNATPDEKRMRQGMIKQIGAELARRGLKATRRILPNPMHTASPAEIERCKRLLASLPRTAWWRAKTQDVPLDDLISIQPTLDEEKVQKMVEAGAKKLRKAPSGLGVRYGSKLFLLDGNHRAASLERLGERTMPVKVLAPLVKADAWVTIHGHPVKLDDTPHATTPASEQSKKVFDELPPSQKKLLLDYKGEDYEYINAHLRNTGEESPDEDYDYDSHISALDRAISDVTLTENTTLWRGAYDVVEEDENNAGLVFQDDGFISTTADRQVAQRFGKGVLFKINAMRGTHALYADSFSTLQEDEYILPRGTTFRVTSEQEEKGHHIVEVSIVKSGHQKAISVQRATREKKNRFVWNTGDVKIIRRPSQKAFNPDEARDEEGKWTGGDTLESLTAKYGNLVSEAKRVKTGFNDFANNPPRYVTIDGLGTAEGVHEPKTFRDYTIKELVDLKKTNPKALVVAKVWSGRRGGVGARKVSIAKIQLPDDLEGFYNKVVGLTSTPKAYRKADVQFRTIGGHVVPIGKEESQGKEQGGEAGAQEQQGQKISSQAHAVYTRAAQKIATDMGIPAGRIEVADHDEPDPDLGNKVGEHDPETGQITLYPASFKDKQELQDTLAHEWMHEKFSKVAGEFNKEQKEYQQGKSLLSGELDVFKELRPVFSSRKDEYARADGQSQYSTLFWNHYQQNPTTQNYVQAVHETLGEVERLNQRGQGKDVHPLFRNLARNVNTFYRRLGA